VLPTMELQSVVFLDRGVMTSGRCARTGVGVWVRDRGIGGIYFSDLRGWGLGWDHVFCTRDCECLDEAGDGEFKWLRTYIMVDRRSVDIVLICLGLLIYA
jgi:hypothetical protein